MGLCDVLKVLSALVTKQVNSLPFDTTWWLTGDFIFKRPPNRSLVSVGLLLCPIKCLKSSKFILSWGSSFWNQTEGCIIYIAALKYEHATIFFAMGLHWVCGNNPPKAGSRAPGQGGMCRAVKSLQGRNPSVAPKKRRLQAASTSVELWCVHNRSPAEGKALTLPSNHLKPVVNCI